ncbi:hypothetical protein [Rhodovulum sp. MB263]|uniref:hypothetical protein n=1 Tax=Rhodovulum sp. (strain MB263) TaxID=308754 RepID=UPI0009B795CA|nr:hypothetical protein [Rhodovulum sp. MB263]ARC88365.1 hypothetical protein B5V46_06930 [Rhodovulum sp. MB263]
MKQYALGRTECGAGRIEVAGQAGVTDQGKRPGPAFAMMVICVPAGWLTLIAALLLGSSLLMAVLAMLTAMWGIFVLGLTGFLVVDALRERRRHGREDESLAERVAGPSCPGLPVQGDRLR